MDNSGAIFGARQRALDEACRPTYRPGTDYPVGEFLKGVGKVVATCLGLALLAHILIAIVGQS